MNNELQHKLSNYEVQPPDGAWEKIAASLDEFISPVLSEKLYQYETLPPTAVWQNIAARLDNQANEEAKVVPFYIRYRRALKYSGAVAIFIFIAVLTSLLISKPSESEIASQVVSNNGSNTKKDTVGTPVDSKESNLIAKKTEKTYAEPLIAKSKTKRVRSEEPVNSFAFAEGFLPAQAERNEMVRSSVAADKYMIYSDGDGNAIRLPKKIFSAFACPTDNYDCRQRLQKLREKFAASATTADFSGLLEILKSLQENQ